jgi:hypothetical protein
MKKLAIMVLVLILFSGVFTVSAQTEEIVDTMVAALGTDFSLLLSGMGTDIVPILQQNALAGQNIGLAELGDDSFYIGLLPVVSATVGNGFLTFRNNTDYFELLDLNALLNDLLIGELSTAIGADTTNLLLDQVTPFPSFKINFGFKLPADLELLVHGFWIPDFLMGFVADTAGVAELAGVELSALNVGGVLRYPILKDSKKSPALSIGAGYYYDSFHAGLGLSDILGGMLEDGGGSTTEDPFAEAGLSLDTSMHTFGLELMTSKKLLFFVPYAKLGAWYGISSFSGSAVLADPEKPITGGKQVNDFAFIAGTGFDLLLGPFCINISGNYNLGSGIWGAGIGTRLQF